MVSSSAQPASRYRRRILGVGALLTGALYVIGAPVFNNRIEADLDGRVPTELESAGFEGITASFSGQDGTLTCVAPLDDPEGARAAAYDIWGVRSIELDRSCRVNTAGTSDDATSEETSGESVDAAATEEQAAGAAGSTVASVPSSTTIADSDLATVHDIVAANPDLAFVAVLLADADIGRRGEPVTLFAPSNEAFDAMSSDELGRLQNDPELLERSLSHHAVGGSILSDDLVDGDLVALDGTTLAVVVGDEITVGGATIVDADIVASNGVVHVIDRVIVAAEPEPAVDPAAEPAEATASYDGATITLSGVVADDDVRVLLTTVSSDAVGEQSVTDELTVDPDIGIVASTAEGMAALIAAMPAGLESGVVGFDGTELFAVGVTQAADDGGAFAAAAEAVGVEPDLTAPPAVNDTDADAAELEEDLNALVAESPILFQPGSAILDASAVEVIDALAELARPVAGVVITVEGHTDSDGVPIENLQLSQNRAEAVQAALIERGLAGVEATGFGSERPVLVDGVEDKVASRRVEFRVTTA